MAPMSWCSRARRTSERAQNCGSNAGGSYALSRIPASAVLDGTTSEAPAVIRVARYSTVEYQLGMGLLGWLGNRERHGTMQYGAPAVRGLPGAWLEVPPPPLCPGPRYGDARSGGCGAGDLPGL